MKDEGKAIDYGSRRAIIGLGGVLIGIIAFGFINHPQYGGVAGFVGVISIFGGIGLSRTTT